MLLLSNRKIFKLYYKGIFAKLQIISVGVESLTVLHAFENLSCFFPFFSSTPLYPLPPLPERHLKHALSRSPLKVSHLVRSL